MFIMVLQNLTAYMVTFTSRRKDLEDNAAWGLEDLINKAITKVKVSQSLTNDMLRCSTSFYNVQQGLRQDDRDISGHMFHTTSEFDGFAFRCHTQP